MSYTLRDFGSYTVGGRIARVTEGEPKTVQFTRTASYEIDPRGHFAIEHAYVQYFVPQKRKCEAPVVLVHGGGMSGSCWETTPDGRPGWLHHLLDWGYEVHVVDNVERGRAGFAPGQWAGDPVLRSMEEAWSLFRIGPKGGFASRTPFANQCFPVAHFDKFAQIFVPRWLTTTELQTEALLAVLEKTGPAIVICHSQGGEITFDAHSKDASKFEAIIALEPSGYPNNANSLSGTSTCIVAGDFLDVDDHWTARETGWKTLSASGHVRYQNTNEIRPGHSHMLMMDFESQSILELAMADRITRVI